MNFNTVDVVYPTKILVPFFVLKTFMQKIIMIVSATYMVTAVYALQTDLIILGILSLFASILHGNLAGILLFISDFSNLNCNIAKIIITLSAIFSTVIGFSVFIYKMDPYLMFVLPIMFLIAIIWTVIIYTGIGVWMIQLRPLSQTGRAPEYNII